ncbi:mevalonate kinase [Chloroflexi bacterium TSY]|nr:mevalonate kinase [Chloroflexi bacterium TSY]
MSKVTASAPGKLMLFGEHAVVYGYPCLVTAVDMRVWVSVALQSEPQIDLDVSTSTRDYTIPVSSLSETKQTFPAEISFVMAVVQRIFRQFNLDTGLKISSKGPTDSHGLGSSSSVTVATATALNQLLDLGLTQSALFALCYSAVLDVQGRASGYDVAAGVYGGTLYYARQGQTIQPLAVENLPIVIGYSGNKAQTVQYVNQVYHLRQQQPELANHIFDLICRIVDKAHTAILRQKWQDVGQLMNINQGLLDSLGVNTLPLATIILAARDAGAWGAKLSGAGGGDCMFAICSETDLNLVGRAIEQVDAKRIDLETNVPGARIE